MKIMATPEQKLRVLIVDDQEPVARSFAEYIEVFAGYEVTMQTSPFEALNLIKREPCRFHAITTDFSMPGMNGIEFAVATRKVLAADPDAQQVWICLITSWERNDPILQPSLDTALKQGVLDAYVNKFHREDLLEELDRFAQKIRE